MLAVVMTRRHTARAHAEGGEGLNLPISTMLQTDAHMPDMCDEDI